jgi:hypothetical protein
MLQRAKSAVVANTHTQCDETDGPGGSWGGGAGGDKVPGLPSLDPKDDGPGGGNADGLTGGLMPPMKVVIE